MAYTDPEYAQFMPGMPTFTSPLSSAPAPVVAPKPAATTAPVKRGRGGVVIADPFPGGTPRTVGMRPFRSGFPAQPDPMANWGGGQGGDAPKALPLTPTAINAVAAAREAPGDTPSPLVPRSGPGPSVDYGYSTPAAAAPATTTNVVPSAQYEDAGPGLVRPSAQAISPYRAKADELLQRADALLEGGGLVDIWKSRGLRRQGNELNAAAAAHEGTVNQAYQNQVHAQQVANQLRLGVGQLRLGGAQLDETRRNNTNVNALHGVEIGNRFDLGTRQITSNERGQDLGLLPHLGQIVRDQQINAALAGGDLEQARDVATVAAPRVGTPDEYELVKDMTGKTTGTHNKRTGVVRPQLDPAEMLKALQAEQRKQAASKAVLEQ